MKVFCVVLLVSTLFLGSEAAVAQQLAKVGERVEIEIPAGTEGYKRVVKAGTEFYKVTGPQANAFYSKDGKKLTNIRVADGKIIIDKVTKADAGSYEAVPNLIITNNSDGTASAVLGPVLRLTVQ